MFFSSIALQKKMQILLIKNFNFLVKLIQICFNDQATEFLMCAHRRHARSVNV